MLSDTKLRHLDTLFIMKSDEKESWWDLRNYSWRTNSTGIEWPQLQIVSL